MFKLKSWILLAALVGLLALIAFTLWDEVGALLVLGVALTVNWLSLERGAALVLRLHRARPLGRREAPHLHRIADQLADRAQIAAPSLMIYPGEMPNAFALDPRAGRGVVAVSSALVRLLNVREITGVLAHEFAHLKNRDSLLSIAAGIFVQAIRWVSHLLGLLLLLNLIFSSNPLMGAELWPLLTLTAFAPLGAIFLQAALMRTRERLADRDAAQLSGDPRGLASALDKIAAHGREMARWYRRFRFIYTAPPERGSTWLRTHPKTEERIRDLLELEGAAREHPAGEPIRQRPLPAKTVFAAAKSGVRRAPREIEVKMPPSIFSGRHSHRLRPRYWWQGPVVVHVRTAGQFGTVSIAR